MHGRTPLLNAIAVASAVAALAALAGCPADTASPTLASATGRYDSGQYALALTESEAVVARGPLADRPQAELVAGMAAFHLDRFDDAERHFLAASRADAPGIRGRARVMLANIRLEQGRSGDAAALFESGAADLSGADADKARRYASLAREGQLGDGRQSPPAAGSDAVVRADAPKPPAPRTAPQPKREKPSAAVPAASPTAAAEQPPPRPASKGAAEPAVRVPAEDATFTVRAGAYTTEAAARRRAKALAADVRRTKSPEPRIAPVTTKDGDTLYAVRIGAFKSRADAEALLKRLARKDLAVGAL